MGLQVSNRQELRLLNNPLSCCGLPKVFDDFLRGSCRLGSQQLEISDIFVTVTLLNLLLSQSQSFDLSLGSRSWRLICLA